MYSYPDFVQSARVLDRQRLILAAGLLLGSVWHRPSATIACTDPVRGELRATIDPADAVETPLGWVLRFPSRPAWQQVEFWAVCRIGD